MFQENKVCPIRWSRSPSDETECLQLTKGLKAQTCYFESREVIVWDFTALLDAFPSYFTRNSWKGEISIVQKACIF
jgi:hypothetical protein